MAAVQGPNPFSPAFGSTPPLLDGRDDVLGRIADAAQAGPTHPNYTLLLTGERGSGKTALLNALEAEASARGWPVIADVGAVEGAGRGRVRFKHRAMRACTAARRHDDLDLLQHNPPGRFTLRDSRSEASGDRR